MRYLILTLLLACEPPVDNDRAIWTQVPAPPGAPPMECWVWSNTNYISNTNFGGPVCWRVK